MMKFLEKMTVVCGILKGCAPASLLICGVWLLASAIAMGQPFEDHDSESRHPPGLLQGSLNVQLAGGIAGGQENDLNANILERAASFDLVNTYARYLSTMMSSPQYFADLLPKLSENEKELLREAIDTRIEKSDRHRQPLSALLNYKVLAAIRNSEAPPQIKRVLEKNLGLVESMSQPPSIDEQNAVFLVYKREELKSEHELAEAIGEILDPPLQELFFKPFAMKGNQFLSHPFGMLYFDISQREATRIRQRVESEITLTANATRRALKDNPQHLRDAANAKRDGKPRPRTPILDRIPVWRAHFETLSLLNRIQLTKFLRLGDQLSSDGTIEDWLNAMELERKEIGYSVLANVLGNR